jgi:hypothetical protein
VPIADSRNFDQLPRLARFPVSFGYLSGVTEQVGAFLRYVSKNSPRRFQMASRVRFAALRSPANCTVLPEGAGLSRSRNGLKQATNDCGCGRRSAAFRPAPELIPEARRTSGFDIISGSLSFASPERRVLPGSIAPGKISRATLQKIVVRGLG